MPSCSETWPKPEQLELYRAHLCALELPQNSQSHLLCVARSLLRTPHGLRPWLRRQVDRLSFRQACRHILGARKFLTFCGHLELEQMLAQVKSCSHLVRALATEVDWEAALHLSRRPKFESPLGDWLRAYLDYRSGRHMKLGGWVFTLRKLDRLAQRENVQTFAQLTSRLLRKFLTEGQTAPSYHNTKLSKLRVLQRFLTSRGVSFELPVGLEIQQPPFRPHIFSLQEIGQILTLAGCRGSQFRGQGIETIIYLLYACGMRISEPLGLRLCDVDLEAGTLFLNCTKFYKQRWVPIGKGARRRLAAYLESRHIQFPASIDSNQSFFLNSQGRAFRRATVEVEFAQIVRELALPSRGSRAPRPHDLRHTLAVHKLYQWYAEGQDVQNKLPLLSAYLGHDRLHHTEVYLHLTDDLVRQAGRNFQRSFENVVGPWMPR